MLHWLRSPLDRLRDIAARAWRPPLTCELGWQPSPYAPVFYGYQDVVMDLSVSPLRDPEQVVAVDPDHVPSRQLATSSARIFYPSTDGSPPTAPILTGCGRYPLVLFAHGECAQPGGSMPDHHAWMELCATLARNGYVVVAPQLGHLIRPSDNVVDQARVVRTLQWMRARWEHRAVLLPSSATGLVGHSRGAGVCAEVVGRGLHEVAAYASLSGSGIAAARTRAGLPKLCTFGGGDDELSLTLALNDYATSVAAPAHVVRFGRANHFEYIPHPTSQQPGQPDPPPRIGCTRPAEGCRYLPFMAADLVTLFFGRHLEGERWDVEPSWWPWFLPWPRRIGPDLRPPTMLLTTAQKFFAGGQWAIWPAVAARGDCDTIIRWTAQGSWHARSV